MTLESLRASAKALLKLDAAGALVPHGIGGHARGIIEEFLEHTAVSTTGATSIAGAGNAARAKCPKCKGVPQVLYDLGDGLGESVASCAACGGSGDAPPPEPCATCRGTRTKVEYGIMLCPKCDGPACSRGEE